MPRLRYFTILIIGHFIRWAIRTPSAAEGSLAAWDSYSRFSYIYQYFIDVRVSGCFASTSAYNKMRQASGNRGVLISVKTWGTLRIRSSKTDIVVLKFWSLGMSIDRLREIEEFLQMLREQKRSLEKEILLTTGLHQTQAEQRLRKDIKPKLREYETEYWQILAAESETVAISEPEAEVVVAEIVEQTGQLQSSQQYSDEVLEWLQKIYAELSKPGTPAAAKLKGALSLLPPFVSLSYEAELDTENFLRTNFPTFTKWSKLLAKKL